MNRDASSAPAGQRQWTIGKRHAYCTTKAEARPWRAGADESAAAVADQAHQQDAGQEACTESPCASAVRLGFNALLQIVDPGAGPVTRLLGARTRGVCCSVLRGTQVVLDLVRIRSPAP